MKKISGIQLIALLIVGRIFLTMTYSPLDSENSLAMIIGGLISTAVQAVIIISPIVLAKKFSDRNVVELGYSVARPIGIFLSLVYSAFVILVAIKTLCDFSAFITFAFPIFTAKKMMIIFMAITALYISALGLEPIVRSSLIVLGLFAIMLMIVLFATSGELDIHNLDLSVEDPLKVCIKSAAQSMGRNTELVLACLILPHLRSKQGCTMYSYIGIKYLVVSLIVFLCAAILGDFAHSAPLPFFHLSAYSDTSVIARFDALFLIVWTLCSVIKLSICFWLAGGCIKYFSPKFKTLYSNAAVCIISLAVVLLATEYIELKSSDHSFPMAAALIVLVGVIPALMLFKRKEKSVKTKV